MPAARRHRRLERDDSMWCLHGSRDRRQLPLAPTPHCARAPRRAAATNTEAKHSQALPTGDLAGCRDTRPQHADLCNSHNRVRFRYPSRADRSTRCECSQNLGRDSRRHIHAVRLHAWSDLRRGETKERRLPQHTRTAHR